MNIAYLITAHTDITQLERLVKELLKSGDVFLFVDGKVEDVEFLKRIELLEQDNISKPHSICFIKKRFAVSWGAFSIVKTQRALLKKALYNSDIKYDRFVLLSGLCYPLWSPRDIIKEFSSHPQKEYISAVNLSETAEDDQRLRYAGYHFFRDLPFSTNNFFKRLIVWASRTILDKLGIKKPNYIYSEGIKQDVYFGGAFMGLTRQCAQYVLSNMDDSNPIIKYLKTSYASDELVIHTIVFNSPYKRFASLKSLNLYKNPQSAFLELAPLHYVLYDKSIKIFTEPDYEELIRSNKMFARKFLSGASDSLIKLIQNRNK